MWTVCTGRSILVVGILNIFCQKTCNSLKNLCKGGCVCVLLSSLTTALPYTVSWFVSGSSMVFNPLSPSIHIQILQTDLHTFPLRISWENLIKHQGIFSFVIIFYILTTLSFDNVWTLLGENCCWSLLALKPSEIFFYRLELGIRSQYWAALTTETPVSYTER